MANFSVKVSHAPYTDRPFVTLIGVDHDGTEYVVWLRPESETDFDCNRIMVHLLADVREIVICPRKYANLPEDRLAD